MRAERDVRSRVRNSRQKANESESTTAARALEEEEEKVMSRRRECALLDTRTFLRIGYKQIPEVIGKKDWSPAWLFALPSFLTSPVKSFEEAAGIPLHKPPDLPPEPKGVNGELLKLVMKSSNEVRQDLDLLARAKRSFDEVQKKFQFMGGPGQQLLTENLAHLKPVLEGGKPEHVTDEDWERMQVQVKESENSLKQMREESIEIGETIEKIQKTQTENQAKVQGEIIEKAEKLRNEVKTLVDEKGASIRGSFVLHCASRLRLSEYVDFLIEMVPPQERSKAISDADMNGCTPLHCALLGTPELYNVDEYYEIVQKLLALGADKDKQDSSGLTALGQYRSVFASKDDFTRAMGLSAIRESQGDTPEAWQPFHEKMEGMLMPCQGETDADKNAKSSAMQDDDESDDDDDFDMEGDY